GGGESSSEGGSAEPKETKEKPTRKAFSLFQPQLENVDRAIEVAKEMANTDKEGHALDMICVDFLATNNGVADLTGYLKKIEKATGVLLVAYDEKEDMVV